LLTLALNFRLRATLRDAERRLSAGARVTNLLFTLLHLI
jgi:hypothetical protein